MDEKLKLMVDTVIRLASGIRVKPEAEEALSDKEWEVVRRVAEEIRAEKRGLLYCGICGKGSFTRRGFYLHLKRTHKEEIATLIRHEIEEMVIVGQ